MFILLIGVLLALDFASDCDLNPNMSYTEILVRGGIMILFLLTGIIICMKKQDID